MSSNNLEVFTKYESEVRSYCRSFPIILSKAKNSHLYDIDGTEYIDFFAAAGALNYGHNNQRIKDALVEYINADGITCSLDMHTEAKRDFISTFQNTILKTRKLNYKMQFTSPSGTSVVESAIKLARKYTGRSNVIAFTNAFHGMTATSLSLTGSKGHRQANAQAGVSRLAYDGYMGSEFDLLSHYRKLLTDPSSGIDLPAAIILETVQGEGGINVASCEWLQGVRTLTKELGILLIVDDIQAGCGRCGEFFSFEKSGIHPDIVCLSKSIGAIGLPIGLLLLTPDIDVWSPGEDNGTFRGNNLAFFAATKMLNLYWKDRLFEADIYEKSRIVGDFLAKLQSLYSHKILASRGRGLMYGLEFKDPEDVTEVCKHCFKNGLIIETCGPNSQVLKLMPALTIEINVLKQGLGIIESAVSAVLGTTNS